MHIGDIRAAELLAEIRRRQPAAAPETPAASALDAVEPWSHSALKAASAAEAAAAGGLLVSSGGTTGAPKLTVIAPDLGIPRILPHWNPLRTGDVLLNLFSAGKMWGAQYFYNALALHSSSTVAPIGSLSEAEFPEWAPTLADMGVTALAGTPNTLAKFARSALDHGTGLKIRAVVWAGEPMTPSRRAAIAEAFPDAGLWGNYGSIETFVIGVNEPECEPGTLHLLPGQLLELDASGALLTRVGPGWPVPALRFRLGDRLRRAECPCGGPDAFAVEGRVDDSFKLYGSLLRAGDLFEQAALVPGVDEAQLVLRRDPEVPSAVVGMTFRYTGSETDVARVRAAMAARVDGLGVLERHTPEAVDYRHVAAVDRSPRTGKVLPIVWTDAPRARSEERR